MSADKADDKDKQNHPGAAFTEKLKSRAKSVTLLDGAGHGNSGIYFVSISEKNTNKKGVSDNLAVYKCNRLLCFNIFKEEENESWEARPEIEDETEADDSDVPDHELGAVMEFDEDLLDEAQTEADARNIAKKHQMSFEALKRDVLGSVRK